MTSKTIRVEVTADDIAEGAMCDPERCPVARALARQLHTPRVAITRARLNGRWVGVAAIRLGIRPEPIEVRLARSVGEFTLRFDQGRPVTPFAFRFVR